MKFRSPPKQGAIGGDNSDNSDIEDLKTTGLAQPFQNIAIKDSSLMMPNNIQVDSYSVNVT
jgi:hypothetical protein